METLDTGFCTKTYSNPDESIRVIKSFRLIHSNICKTSLKDTRIGTNHKFRVLDWDPWIRENRSKSRRIGTNRLKSYELIEFKSVQTMKYVQISTNH